MFGFLKRKKHKGEDLGFDDVKSGVLGKDYYEPEPVPEKEFAEPRGMGEPFEPDQRFGSPRPSEKFGEPLSIDQPMTAEPRTGRDYDILERLNLIESNLLAIRNQTETINERLKNLEMKLTRRY